MSTLNDHKNYRYRWRLASLKWDLFIREPPSELVTRTARQPPLKVVKIDEKASKIAGDHQVILGIQFLIDNSTQSVNMSLTQPYLRSTLKKRNTNGAI